MSEELIPLNTAQAAFIGFIGATVEYQAEESGQPIAVVTIPTPGSGNLGAKSVALTNGINVLTQAQYEKGIITFTDGGAAAVAVFPAVTSDETEAFQRTIRNKTADNVTLRSNGHDYIVGPGVNQVICFLNAEVEPAVTGV